MRDEKVIIPQAVVPYLLHGLKATPAVLETLLRGVTDAEADRRPDPERFTIREVTAHLADWEPVWLERMERMRSEESPLLQGYDEGQWAIDHNYAQADVAEQAALFRSGRERLIAFLESLDPDEWARTGRHTQWGTLRIYDLAAQVLGHDGYHTRQIIEWRSGGDRR
jgi:hypothetical protein